MPAHLESDDVDDMGNGTYVWWMQCDEDIERDHLGEIFGEEEEDGKRKMHIKFPKGKFKVYAKKLNVADFQKGTFVHVATSDYDMDLIGQIKDLDNGKLLVEINGEDKFFDPKYLIRCDFQPGMFVFWTRSDEDIEKNHMGEVLSDFSEKGVKVKFPKGAWRFKPYQLVRAPIQLRSLVLWTKSDDDIAKGEVGQVIKAPNDEGRMKVQFAKGAWRFRPEELYQIEMQLGSFVTWSSHDEDVLKGHVGEVKKVKVSEGRLSVEFPKGQWNFKVNQLNLYHLQPGQFVYWQKCDDDIPRGHIGEIVRRHSQHENRFSVQWPKGHWSMKPGELAKVAHQRDDRVQWNQSDDDIPEGHIGYVIGIRYNGSTAGEKLRVRWPKGIWSHKPNDLKSINLDNDATNELKATFKRFDKNGDGKLSLEEMSDVLKSLGGGLSDDECAQLFEALDKDGNGKLTSDEFIDYVFGTEVSGSQKKLLGDGFGLGALLGLEDDDEEEDDDDDDPNSGGGGGNQVEQQNFDIQFDAEDKEGIDGETMVNKAEWAAAMLTVGVPRVASLESFQGAVADLGEEAEEVAVKHLAMELNGLGGAPGTEELRGAIGRVKKGKVEALNLEQASEESEWEMSLAKTTGLDAMLRHLQVNKKSLEEAASELEHAFVSPLEEKALGAMGPDELVEAVKEAAQKPKTLSVVSSYFRAREKCRRHVQEIIDQCSGSGEKFVDSTWDPDQDINFVMYVDKEAPGWDCTARLPDAGWKRAKELGDDMTLVKGDAGANDVDQGSCGDCFLLGALGAIAANRKRFIRHTFVHYDMEIGVYGVLFCLEGNWTYEIIDDKIGMRSSRTPKWAKSIEGEMWVSLLEKAYFKHHTCAEMCDGGHGTESIFCLLGGVTGSYDVGHQYFDKPDKYFEIINKALGDGELMTTGWYAPSKGKYANLEGGEGGPCGETGLPYGLIGGHCYSVIRTAVHNGTNLILVRNPWGSGEWKGPWSDKSEEMTDEVKEALNHGDKVDGCFWMAMEDFVQVSKNCKFTKHFGPTWQCAVIRGHYSNEAEKGRAKKDFQASADDEISFKKGDMIELSSLQGHWSKGKCLANGEEGYFRSKDVEVQMKNVLKITLDVADIQKGEPLIFAMLSENQLMRREFTKRKTDGLNYKDKKQPSGLIIVRNKDGKREKKLKLRYRHVWDYLDPSKAPYTIYMAICRGKGMRYNVYGYSRHGKIILEQHETSYSEFLDKAS